MSVLTLRILPLVSSMALLSFSMSLATCFCCDCRALMFFCDSLIFSSTPDRFERSALISLRFCSISRLLTAFAAGGERPIRVLPRQRAPSSFSFSWLFPSPYQIDFYTFKNLRTDMTLPQTPIKAPMPNNKALSCQMNGENGKSSNSCRENCCLYRRCTL